LTSVAVSSKTLPHGIWLTGPGIYHLPRNNRVRQSSDL
jgi:hypothetical protein